MKLGLKFSDLSFIRLKDYKITQVVGFWDIMNMQAI
jgi:ketosteroid isomerase-like protein